MCEHQICGACLVQFTADKAVLCVVSSRQCLWPETLPLAGVYATMLSHAAVGGNTCDVVVGGWAAKALHGVLGSSVWALRMAALLAYCPVYLRHASCRGGGVHEWLNVR